MGARTHVSLGRSRAGVSRRFGTGKRERLLVRSARQAQDRQARRASLTAPFPASRSGVQAMKLRPSILSEFREDRGISMAVVVSPGARSVDRPVPLTRAETEGHAPARAAHGIHGRGSACRGRFVARAGGGGRQPGAEGRPPRLGDDRRRAKTRPSSLVLGRLLGRRGVSGWGGGVAARRGRRGGKRVPVGNARRFPAPSRQTSRVSGCILETPAQRTWSSDACG